MDRYGGDHVEMAQQSYEVVSDAIYQFLERLELANLKERIALENRELRRQLGYLGVRSRDPGSKKGDRIHEGSCI